MGVLEDLKSVTVFAQVKDINTVTARVHGRNTVLAMESPYNSEEFHFAEWHTFARTFTLKKC